MGHSKVRLAAAVIVALVGVLVMWQSTEWGYQAVSTSGVVYVGDGGRERAQSYSESLRLMGAIMLGVGLLRALGPGREGE